MNPSWEALNARARGLATRLLGRRRIVELAEAADLASLCDRLAAYHRASADRSDADELERGVEKAAAELVLRLKTWAGDSDALAIVFENEDRRCLRRLLRGAVQGAWPATRLAGLLPTPRLTAAMINDLATQPSPSAVIGRLVGYRHPLAPRLSAAVARGETDLFSLELALNRAFAERARYCARRGPRALREYVAMTIDLENVWSALLSEPLALGVEALFLEGGCRLDRATFLMAARPNDIQERRDIVAKAFDKTAIATLLRDRQVTLSQLEGRILSAQIAEQLRAARTEPLGPAPVLLYALRQRGETHDLLLVIWGKACDMPPTLITEGLVTS